MVRQVASPTAATPQLQLQSSGSELPLEIDRLDRSTQRLNSSNPCVWLRFRSSDPVGSWGLWLSRSRLCSNGNKYKNRSLTSEFLRKHKTDFMIVALVRLGYPSVWETQMTIKTILWDSVVTFWKLELPNLPVPSWVFIDSPCIHVPYDWNEMPVRTLIVPLLIGGTLWH